MKCEQQEEPYVNDETRVLITEGFDERALAAYREARLEESRDRLHSIRFSVWRAVERQPEKQRDALRISRLLGSIGGNQ